MNSDINRLLEDFCLRYKTLTFKKGHILVRGDDEPGGVYFVREGVVKMAHTDLEGSELIVNLYKPGTFLPMIWAIAGVKNTYSYQAFTKVKAIRVPKDEFLEFLNSNPEVLMDLTRRLLVGLDGIVGQIKGLLGTSAEVKVAMVLRMLSSRFGTQTPKGIKITLPVTHQDIANFAGLSRETVTIAMKKIKEDGLVIAEKREITVKNQELLKKLF